MVTITMVLSLLQALPACWADRHDARKPEQLRTIAAAVASTDATEDEATLLVTVAWHESRLCLRTHAGVRGAPGQGLWQLERGSHRRPPFAGLSLEATSNAAAQALWVLRHSWQCGTAIADRVTAYAGRPCHTAWPTLRERANTYWWLRHRARQDDPTRLEETNEEKRA